VGGVGIVIVLYLPVFEAWVGGGGVGGNGSG